MNPAHLALVFLGVFIIAVLGMVAGRLTSMEENSPWEQTLISSYMLFIFAAGIACLVNIGVLIMNSL